MELVLSIALGLAAVAAVVGWSRLHEERTRALRLADELKTLRTSESSHRIVDHDTGSAPVLPRLTSVPEGEEDRGLENDARVAEVRRFLERAEEALAAAEARPRVGSALPIESLREEAVELLSTLERLEIGFSAIPGRGAALLADRPAPEGVAVPPPPAPVDGHALGAGLRGSEDLADTAGRLKELLAGLARSTDRLREATGASSEALAAVARGADAIAPMAGALSAVANRVNLLALNLAVLVSPGGAGTNVEEAGTELRSIFEEARRLSREVGALAQRVASAARGAAERNAELATAIAEERTRVDRGVVAIDALGDLAGRLRDAFESLRAASRDSDEASAGMYRALGAAAAKAEALAGELSAERAAVAAFIAPLQETAAGLTQVRIAAERTVRNLLAIAETAAERRAPATDPAALDALRQASRLLP